MLVKNRALGDSIMGLSAVSYLKQLYPKSNIIYAVPQWIAPLYSESKTKATLIYPLTLTSFSDGWRLFNDLQKMKVDHVHEMHQSGRGAKFFKWICFFLGIRYTAHNHHIKTPTKVIDQGVILPLIQRDLDGVFSFFGKEERPNYLSFTPKITPKEKLEKARMIIMGVVATRETKMWPLHNFVELAKLIMKKYPHYAVVIPLSKSEADKKIKESLFGLGLSDNISILEWDLCDLPTNFQQAALYIGNDTGLKHLAIAVGIKTYTFFGPEPAQEWHPYKTDDHPYFYQENLSCRTRTHHYCGLSVCDLKEGNMQCLNFFSAEHIFSQIEQELLP
jgi:heptosyltransferase-2